MTRPLAAVLLATAVVGAGLPASADTSGKKIALSNNYAGNSWRQAMLKSWDKVTKPAVADGIVAAADPFTTAENQVTEQAAQIQNLILQGYDAIVLNAASPDALNGAVKEACDAGITVVSFDGIVTEPCAWRIAVDFKQMGKDEVALPRRARCRTAATSSRSAASPASSSTTRSPRASTRASPRTRSSRSSARCTATGRRTWRRRRSPASCRACPTIVGVVTQGGDGYGAAQAFKAAGRRLPIDHHGQPPGRAGLVEGAEGRQRLRDHVGLDRPRRLDAGLLGRPADPRRQGGAQGPRPCRSCASTRTTSRQTSRPPRRAASPMSNTRSRTPQKVIAGACEVTAALTGAAGMDASRRSSSLDGVERAFGAVRALGRGRPRAAAPANALASSATTAPASRR